MDAAPTRARANDHRSRWRNRTLATVVIATVAVLAPATSGFAQDPGGNTPVSPVRLAETAATVHAFATEEARAKVEAAVSRWWSIVVFAAAFDEARRAQAAHDAVWDRMAACETGGNWSMRGSSYSGGVGFANSTWNAFGGREFASNAGDATREQQIVVAERVRAAVGYRAWGCAGAAGVG